ncbi:MAG: glycine cleavage system aminomethyltransferase GcvT [Cytophagaceae bacterium]|nr:glycine cleavage system aminomethyltransferase GcvT [Cytophagaceae bacterium]MDW8457028.1 glycine cleavage system aminomethyltransferase GcvT [Cytophagaceae bacterium]
MENNKNIKKIFLHDVHLSLNARMIPFAGFYMPVRYTSDMEEHITVRTSVGVFDVSHMGEFVIEGPQAIALLQKITTNDVSRLTIGKAQYSCMTNARGGIIDDIVLYRTSEHSYMMVVNASNIDKDWNWIQMHNTEGATLKNISDSICLFAVQGPNAKHCMQKLIKENLDQISYYSFIQTELAGVPDILLSNTGYTGSGGYEVYVSNENALYIWQAIMNAGSEYGIKPIGLGARDTLRLEMGYCLYGNDIDETTTPIEAGLGWITKLNKSFIGHEVCIEQKNNGVSKKLCGFVMAERGIPRSGYKIMNRDAQQIGIVTSGTQSPSLAKGIGMGYINTEHAIPDKDIYIQIRDVLIKAFVVKPPFYKK